MVVAATLEDNFCPPAHFVMQYQSQKTQAFVLQILRRYLTKEDRFRKLFYCLIRIKEPCLRKSEGLTCSKILGILQADNNIGKSPSEKFPEAYISKTFDLNDIKFVRVVKKCQISITFQKFGPVAPNLHGIVFDDII